MMTPEISDFCVCVCVCEITFSLEFCDFRNVKIKNHFFIWKDINI